MPVWAAGRKNRDRENMCLNMKKAFENWPEISEIYLIFPLKK